MAKKKKTSDAAFLLFDVIYEDGSRSSNRRMPSAELDPLDRDGSARAFLEGQDRKIAETSGKHRPPIKSVTPSPD